MFLIVGSTLATAKLTSQSASEKLNDNRLRTEDRPHAYIIQTATASAMYALALELALKLLIEELSGTSAQRTHDLSKLFASLPHSTQGALKSRVPDCDNFLSLHRTSFEDWRYFHDASPKNVRTVVDGEKCQRLISEILELFQTAAGW